MITDKVLTILTIIIAIIQIPMMFLSAILAVFVQKWITQPKPKPAVNNPKGRIRRNIRAINNLVSSPWYLLFVLSINIALGVSGISMFEADPRLSILIVVFAFCLGFFHIQQFITKVNERKFRALRDRVKALEDKP